MPDLSSNISLLKYVVVIFTNFKECEVTATEEASYELQHIRNNGHNIIELLSQADGLLREELRTKCDDKADLETRLLLEAQLNVSRAIEALHDRALSDYTF